jgi:fibronectin type 3 domain-containing protein
MSWEAWISLSSLPSLDGQIVALSSSATGWQLKVTRGSGPITFAAAVSDGTNRIQRFSKTVPVANTWYHVAGVYNAAAQTLDIYVNGVLDDGTLSGAVPAAQVIPTGVNPNLGRRISSGSTGILYFPGLIDEVRVYNAAVTQAQIQSDMNTPVTPTAPTNLTATPFSTTQINLSWTASTGIAAIKNYVVQRCAGVGCTTFATVASPTTTTYSDTGLASNSYSYRVSAVDTQNNSGANSSTATATTVAPPTAPTNVTATAISTSQINLNWTASSSGNGIQNYVVQRCAGAGCSNFATIGSPTTTTFNDSGLTPGTSYSYQVSGVDTQNTPGPYSTPPATAITQPPPPPTAPTNVTATTISATQINLSWTASTSIVGIKNYVVQRCAGAGCTTFAPIGTPTTLTTYNDTGLTPGTSYSYQVNAVDTQNNPGPNSTPPATAATTALPTAPTNVTATAMSGTQISLSWTASTSSLGIKNYVLQRCAGAGCSNFATIASPTTTTYNDTGLIGGTSYSYQVSAIDTQNNAGPNSTPAATATTTGAPTAPTNVTATAIGATQINLSWTASTSSIGINDYVVQRCQGAGCTNFVQIATTTTTTYSDTPLAGGTSYRYQVNAVDTQSNAGPNSAPPATATTSPAPTTITFVQGNSAVPQTPQTSVPVAFTGPQTAGNLNVVAVGWSDSTATITSVTDSSSCNSYTLAVGPTIISGTSTLAIYYAKNICPSANNTVTVTFSSAANFPDVRILEYSGADLTNPVDVTAANTGTSATAATTPVSTTNPTDLLFGANLGQQGSTGPGTGFTQRVLTSPDGNIAEDQMVTTTGSYSASAPMFYAAWIMQMVAFRTQSASSAPPPTAPANVTASVISSSQINLSWTASSSSIGVKNYLVQRCQGAGCTAFAPIGSSATTTYNDTGLAAGTSYSYQVNAVDIQSNPGPNSAPPVTASTFSALSPTAPTNVTATPISTTQINLSWTASTSSFGIQNYVVQRCAGVGCTNFVQIGTPTTTTYNDTGLTPATSYSYIVSPVDIQNNPGPNSNPPATTMTAGASVPTNVTATPISTSQINLSWTASTSNAGIQNYLVMRCQGAGCSNFAQIGTPATNSYNDTGLAISTSYSYVVSAVDNQSISSANSTPPATATTNGPSITFVQGNSATPQTPQTTVPVAFTAAQTAGDLNVVAVGWSDSTATIKSIVDNSGNHYTLAVGPTIVTGTSTLAIYYAKNINASAANTVTVTFNSAATFADIRILEYSGADQTNPVDVVAANTGFSATAATNPISTSNPTDLLFGANLGQQASTGPGAGFTSRLLTSPNGNIAEDRMVTSTGAYSASAPMFYGAWTMQMVAFRTPAPLTAPTNVTALPASATQINLSWTAATSGLGIKNYVVQRCQGAGCTVFAPIGSPTTATTYNDTGLTELTSYSYQVNAVDTQNNTGPNSTPPATATTPSAQSPAAPTNVTATSISGTQINLSWTASVSSNGIQNYVVQRCAGAGCTSFAQVGTPTTTTYNDTGLTGGTSYSYVVSAIDTANLPSPNSNPPATAMTAGATAPTNVTATTISSTQINLSWTASTSNAGIQNYVVQRCRGVGCSNFAQIGTPTTTTYNDTGLLPSASYSYVVSAVDNQNNTSANSTPPATATTNTPTITFIQGNSAVPQTPQTSVPVAFTGPQTAGNLNVVAVGWSDSTATITSINDTGGNQYILAAGPTIIAGTSTLSTYYAKNIHASAANNTVTVTFSAAANFPDVRILEYSGADQTNPVDVTAASTGSSATAATTPVSTTNATDLLFGANLGQQASTGPGAGYTQRLLTSPNGNIAEDQMVTATGSYSASAPMFFAAWIMHMVAFRTQALVTPPTNVTATAISATQINLSWTASTGGAGIQNYVVQRCQGAGCSNFATVASPTTNSYNDTGLTTGASYSYQVSAIDTLGNPSLNSTPPATATTTVPPTAPSNVTATAVGPSQINLSWTASTSGVGILNYVVQRCQGVGCSTFSPIGTPTTTTYSDTGLTTNNSYSYVVSAVDTQNNPGPNSAPPATATTVPSTLLAAYGMNEGSGTTTADSSGHGYTGTLNGATWTAAGKYGKALSFNGTTNFVDLGAPAGLLNSGTMTWEAWVSVSALTSFGGNIMAFANSNLGWELKTSHDTGVWTFAIAVSNGSTHIQRYSKTVPALNTFYHVAGVYNATAKTLDIYVNGVLDDGTLAGTVPASDTLPTGFNISIGRRMSGSPPVGNSYFPGIVDEVRMYSSALTQTQIQTDMNTPVGAIQPPTAPTNVTAIVISSTQINLSWTASTSSVGIQNYVVQRCQSAGCVNFSQVGTSTTTTYNDAGLTGGTSYSYQVNAVDALGNQGPNSTPPATATTNTSVPPPTAPTNVTATAISTSQINLSWTASTSSAGIKNYVVQRCAGAACSNFATVASPTTTSFSDTGLGGGISYSYQVSAIDTLNQPGPNSSPAATATTLGPTAPTNVTATPISTTQINLSWTASSSSAGIKNYVVQRCSGAGCNNFLQVGTPTGTTFNDTGLTAGTSYSYVVSAIDNQNNTSGNSIPPATAITLTNSAPGLLAAYGFNEFVGTQTFDASSNGFTGTLNGTTWTNAGKFSNALSFDGIQGFVDLGAPAPLQITGSMTLEAWTFNTSFPPADGQIIAQANDQSGWELKNSTDTGVEAFAVAISNGTQRIQRYSKTVPILNTWYHVAGVYDAAAKVLHIYVNGVLDDGTLVGTVPGAQVVPSGVNLNIGRRVKGGVPFTGGYYFAGTIDEVRIYNTVLTQAQIQTDMTTPIGAGGQASVQLAPPSLTFSNQVIGTSSSAQTVTLTNTGTAGMSFGTTTVTSSGPVSYSYTTDCGATLGVNSSCHFNVTFKPTSTGSLSGTLVITDSAPGSPHSVPLNGTGVASAGISVSPRSVPLTFTRTQQFTAYNPGGSVTWSVDNITGGQASTGTITANGLYTPPATTGVHTITATSSAGSASATVNVVNYTGTFTRDVDSLRTGLNPNETILTTANVNSTNFGRVYSYPLDGQADASPLYVANVSIPGKGSHNVVYVATEHDSVFAFDADGLQSAPLWQVSFINPSAGITTVPWQDLTVSGTCNGVCDIFPEIGITGTPVIDPASNTMYVVVKTRENGSYFHRLHALNITTGAEKFGGPVVISGSVAGTGQPQSGGQVTFQSLRENQRPALLLTGGVVYIAFAAHSDVVPYHGWVFGYNASTLTQTMIFNTSPSTGGSGSFGAGIWMSGDGLATDPTGDLYFVTGNGIFDVNTGGKDYGDSLVRIHPNGTVFKFFTPADQANDNANDLDLGSGGVTLLPAGVGNATHPNLALTAGKDGAIYLIDRDNPGAYNGSTNSNVQTILNEFPNGTYHTGNFKAPVYWNGKLFYSADADTLRAFSISNAQMSTSPTSTSTKVFQYPGTTLGLSSNGNTSGILWVIERVDLDPLGNGTRGPGALHAFDATNLATELYNTTQASGSRDMLDFTCKWSAPLVANGRVYVASESLLTIFGLLP